MCQTSPPSGGEACLQGETHRHRFVEEDRVAPGGSGAGALWQCSVFAAPNVKLYQRENTCAEIISCVRVVPIRPAEEGR